MKQRVVKLLAMCPVLLLVAGILNMASAWGFCLWAPRRMRSESTMLTTPLFDPTPTADTPRSSFGRTAWYTPIKVFYVGPGFRGMTVSWLTTPTGSIRRAFPGVPPTETVVEAGWPVRCVRMHEVKSAIGQPAAEFTVPALKRGIRIPPRPAWMKTAPVAGLPIDPMPARFALGSGFYFAVTLIPVAGVAAARHMRRVRRRARDECEHCGYEASRTGPCPECGRQPGLADDSSEPSRVSPPISQ